MSTDVETRAARHAALGDHARLAIVEELLVSDLAPVEIRRLLGIESNLLAHHLDVLEDVGLIERTRSSGDGRRRYVKLNRRSLDELAPDTAIPIGPALFVCRANSARSQLAAAMWREIARQPALSAGTHPAERVHPGAVAAARRAGLDLGATAPRDLADISPLPPLVVTVCDRSHEEVEASSAWLHWSIPDPVPVGTAEAFDSALAELRARIDSMVELAGAP